jgi:hypothetical protein
MSYDPIEAARLEAARLAAAEAFAREQATLMARLENQICPGGCGNVSPGGIKCANCIAQERKHDSSHGPFNSLPEVDEAPAVGAQRTSEPAGGEAQAQHGRRKHNSVHTRPSDIFPKKWEWFLSTHDHHIFPKEWEWYFKEKVPGFNIHDWTMTIPAKKHSQIHGWWNAEWALWIFEHEHPTLADVENKAVELLERAGIEEEWMHSYQMKREMQEEKEARNICPVCRTKTSGGVRCQACLENELRAS